jgi:chromosome partitioning protein
MTTIAFFNNKGGVGKTSLVYHLAWMYADLGLSVLAADLDPQANLTAVFVDEDRMEALWPESQRRDTVFGALQPLLDGTGDIAEPHVEHIDDNIGLLVGDLALALSEDELNAQWPRCMDGQQRAFRVISAFWRLVQRAAQARAAHVTLIDVGPNLGAINRAALIAARHVVVPLAPDLYSLQGLRNLGPTLSRWRREWTDRRTRNPLDDLSIPAGEMQPAGYVVMQHAVRLDRPVRSYDRWMARIPSVYRSAVLGENSPAGDLDVRSDPHSLSALRNYRSLMPLAQEARKPMFFLKAADGAIGGHARAVSECYVDFRDLARAIAARCELPLP